MSAAVRGVRRRSSGGWPAFWGLLAALAAEAAGLGLFAVSGWFIASCAIAGAAITSFSFFEPSAVVRGIPPNISEDSSAVTRASQIDANLSGKPCRRAFAVRMIRFATRRK